MGVSGLVATYEMAGTEVVDLDGFCWLLEGACISSGKRKQTRLQVVSLSTITT